MGEGKEEETDAAQVAPDLQVGSWFWICSASEPTEFEERLATTIRGICSEIDFVFLSIYSLSPRLSEKEYHRRTLKFAGSDAHYIILTTKTGDEFRSHQLSLNFNSDCVKNVKVSEFSHRFNEEEVLVAFREASVEKEDGFSIHRAYSETGLVSCFLGSGMIFPPIISSFFSAKERKFFTRKLTIREKAPLDDIAQKFGNLIDAEVDFSLLGEPAKKALRMLTKARGSKDEAAKWVYYRAALEQSLGRNYINEIRRRYKRHPKAKNVAEQTVSRLKSLRDSLVHHAEIGTQSSLDERAIHSIVLDGIGFRFDGEFVLTSILRELAD